MKDDIAEDEESDLGCKFFRVSNATGEMVLTEIEQRPLKHEMLDTNDVFIVEMKKQIYVWVGRKAEFEEKKQAMKTAREFVKVKGKPKGTRVTKTPEHSEDAIFCSLFEGFYGAIQLDLSVPSASEQLEDLYKSHAELAKVELEELSNAKMSVFLCQNMELVPLPKEEWGHFYEQNVYMVDMDAMPKKKTMIQLFGNRKNYINMSDFAEYFDKLIGYVSDER